MRNTKKMVLLSMFIAIELAVGLIPNIGYIRINPTMSITIMHIPVILAGVLLGPASGAVVGFFFGLTSLINATFILPNPIESPIFSPFFQGGVFHGNGWSLVICFVPRILVGLFAGLIFVLLQKINKFSDIIALLAAGLAGSLTNTVLVLGGIFLFFRESYAAAYEMSVQTLWDVIVGIITFNGMLEAAVAAFITVAVGKSLLVYLKRVR